VDNLNNTGKGVPCADGGRRQVCAQAHEECMWAYQEDHQRDLGLSGRIDTTSYLQTRPIHTLHLGYNSSSFFYLSKINSWGIIYPRAYLCMTDYLTIKGLSLHECMIEILVPSSSFKKCFGCSNKKRIKWGGWHNLMFCSMYYPYFAIRSSSPPKLLKE
jgi:hypothetical protein